MFALHNDMYFCLRGCKVYKGLPDLIKHLVTNHESRLNSWG